MSEIDQIKRVDRTLIANGAIIDYYQDTMELPNGKYAKWDLIDHKGAAAVVAVLDDGRLLIVKQYRNAPERVTLELPAGGRNGRNEDTLITARRELEEETGYECVNIRFLTSIYTTVAFCNEKIDIYLATGLKRGKQHLDEDEFLNVSSYTLEELKQMILENKIQDAKTICGVLTYAATL